MRCSLKNGGLLSFGCGLEMRCGFCKEKSVVKNHLPCCLFLKWCFAAALCMISPEDSVISPGDSVVPSGLRGSRLKGQRGSSPGSDRCLWLPFRLFVFFCLTGWSKRGNLHHVVGIGALVGLTRVWARSMTHAAGSATRVQLLLERVHLPCLGGERPSHRFSFTYRRRCRRS